MKRFVSLFVILILLLVLAGCALETGGGGEIRHNLGTEPQTLDTALLTGIPESTVMLQMWEGLTRLDANNDPQAAAAEDWKISEDGTVYTFTLREGLKWANGDPLTASDFEYAWKRALDPKLAGDYAYMLYYIEGAEEYNSQLADLEEGEEPPEELPISADTIAVKALGENTLEVKLNGPTPYFLALTAFPTYYPLNQEIVEANYEEWAVDIDSIIGNGPFKLNRWELGEMELIPNEYYWDKDAVKLDKLLIYMVEDESTELTMFETGELDVTNSVPGTEIPRLEKEYPDELHIFPYLGIYYYIFNCSREPFDDVRVRKALTFAIDRETIVNDITRGGQIPAYAYVPPAMLGPDGKDFRKEGGDYFVYNVEKAKELLADAGYPEGKDFPPFEILYNKSEMHKLVGEAIMEMWKNNLGITGITLRQEEWGTYLDSRDEGTFDVSRAGWIADFKEPITFLDMFVTGSGNNNTFWGDKEFDQIVKELTVMDKAEERIPKLHLLEDILMRDMPLAPIYFYTLPMMVNKNVKGYVNLSIGGIDYKSAYVED